MLRLGGFFPGEHQNSFVEEISPHEALTARRKIGGDNFNKISPCTTNSDFDVDESVILFHLLQMSAASFADSDASVSGMKDEAAENFQIGNRTDVTFRTLVNMAKEKLYGEIIEEFDINQALYAKSLKGVHNSGLMLPVSDHKGSCKGIDSILRSRGKETFILQSDYVDLQASPFVTSELEPLFYRREKAFNDHFNVLLNPKLVIKGENDVLFLHIWGLALLLIDDQSLADQLRFDVVARLVEILSVIDLDEIKYWCVIILSHARSDECSGVMKDEALPLFVKLMDSDVRNYMVEAVIALTRLAYARPDYVHVLIKNNALGVAQKISSLYSSDVCVINELAKFMVAVCRGQSLSVEAFNRDEVDASLTILDNLLQEKINYWLVGAALTILDNLFQPKIKSIDRVVRACHALSYLSFGSFVPIEKGTLKRLIWLTFHADYTVAGSALGVIGNIARWGSNDQIQYLAKDTQLLQSLGRKWLRCENKLFQIEACQIISNIAAQSKTFRKNMVKHGLMNPLCRLFEDGEPDVKQEVAWSLFNSIYGGKYFKDN